MIAEGSSQNVGSAQLSSFCERAQVASGRTLTSSILTIRRSDSFRSSAISCARSVITYRGNIERIDIRFSYVGHHVIYLWSELLSNAKRVITILPEAEIAAICRRGVAGNHDSRPHE